MSLIIREANDEDLHFVRENWLDNYRTAHAAGLIQMTSWRDVMGPQLQAVLDREGVEVLVAANPKFKGTRIDLYGWIAHEKGRRRPLVHYIYVKDPYRGQGIARKLFAAAGIDPEQEFLYTCKTGVVTKLKDVIPRARWSPLTARFAQKSNP